MRRIHRKLAWDREGVSEIVGTFLILAITVIIFSGIILWVTSFPGPEPTRRADLDATAEPGVWINITHRGGEPLRGFLTDIVLLVNGETEVLQTQGIRLSPPDLGMPYGIDGDQTWNAGEVWRYKNQTIDMLGDTVQLVVIDTESNSIVWTKELLGFAGQHPPLFLDKWADGVPLTPNRDTVQQGKVFHVYARIMDKDGDFDADNLVAVDLTFDANPAYNMTDDGDPLYGDAMANDGLWSTIIDQQAKLEWDGGILIFQAEDDAGHQTTTRMTLTVEPSPETNIFQNFTIPGGIGPGNLPGNELQRFQIYNASEWDKLTFAGNGTRNFVKGETVVVIVATVFLPNVALQNTFLLFDQITGLPVVYGGGPVGSNSIPSSTNAFIQKDFVGGYYIYEYRFNTTSEAYGYDDGELEYGRYPLSVNLKAEFVPPPNNVFQTWDSINVTDENGTIPDYPQLLTFADAAHLIPTNTFNYTDIAYVKIVVMDTDGTFSIGDVFIQDYSGGTQIAAPAGVTPVGVPGINNSESYSFTIDLSKPNFDPWLFGENSYGFRVLNVIDANEEYTLALSSQLVIRGPRWHLDIVGVMEEFDHQVHDEKVYAIFYEYLNAEDWSSQWIIQSYKSLPSAKDPPWGSGAFYSVVFADINMDGNLDVVIGLEVGHVFWYRNLGGQGHAWQRYTIDSLSSPVNAVDAGIIDQDTDWDVVAGTDNGDIWWYANHLASWTPTLVDSTGSPVNAIKLGDVTGDDVNDLVVGLDNGDIHVYINDGAGNFGSTSTADFEMVSDIAVLGTVSGTYQDTVTSNDGYESIAEVLTDAFVTDFYYAVGETNGADETVGGSYVDTTASDNQYETLTECASCGGNRKTLDFAAQEGHRWDMGSITIGGGEWVDLEIESYISVGTEPFDVGFSASGTGVTWCGEIPSSRAGAGNEGTDTFNLTACGYTGGDLWVHVLDNDITNGDDDPASGGDSIQTTLSVDLVQVNHHQPSGQTGGLEHKWQTQVLTAGGNSYRFFVEAYHTTNTDLDDFTFQWSAAVDGPWTDMVVITKIADNDQYQSFSLPNTVGGTSIYIRAIDNDRLPGKLNLDTLYIDHMFVRRFLVTPNFNTIATGSVVWDLSLGDIDGDDDVDIVAGLESGSVRISYNDGTGESWPTFTSLTGSGAVYAVDVGYIDSDDSLDVVAGTSDNKVYWWTNGAWTRTTIDTTDTAVRSLRVGDVDGDFWDDIVVGTEIGNQVTGKILLYRNQGGAGWDEIIVDSLATTFWDVDIGDADRNETIEPETY